MSDGGKGGREGRGMDSEMTGGMDAARSERQRRARTEEGIEARRKGGRDGGWKDKGNQRRKGEKNEQ